MIRVYKSPNAPRSLSITQAYNGEDVLLQLENDHYKKCYLCERSLCTDFQVEHLKSQKNFPDLKQDWNNLFWSCGYCNEKKGNNFNNLLNPSVVNIEEVIKQVLNFLQKQAVFTPLADTDTHKETCQFLTKIHNGKNGLRTKREENFFECIMGVVNNFYRLINQYLNNPTEENKTLVRENLQINKECLGFKYWIIKNNTTLYSLFADDIVWNKQ